MSKLETTFQLDPKCFNQFRKFPILSDQFSFSVQDKQVSFRPEEMIFISPEAFQYCWKTNSPFQIEPDFAVDEIVSMLQLFKSLFVAKSEIIINHENVDLVSFLAQKLNNTFLTKMCKKVSEDNVQIFSLSFEMLSVIPKAVLQRLNNFKLIVNGEEFLSNSAFFSTISQKVLELCQNNPSASSIQLHLKNKNEIICCISSILNFLEGKQFRIK
jgi:hypothetical protein